MSMGHSAPKASRYAIKASTETSATKSVLLNSLNQFNRRNSSAKWFIMAFLLLGVMLGGEQGRGFAAADKQFNDGLLETSHGSYSSTNHYSKRQQTSAESSTPVMTPAEANTNYQKGEVPLLIAFVGLGLYSIVGLLTLIAMIFPPHRVSPTRQSAMVQRVFSVLVIVFCVTRVVYWCFPIAHVTSSVSYVVNQFCLNVCFTMFTLIIFFWAEQYHRKYFDTQSLLPRLRNVFIIVNTFLWAFEILIVVLALVFHQIPNNGSEDETHWTPPLEPPSNFEPTVAPQILISDVDKIIPRIQGAITKGVSTAIDKFLSDGDSPETAPSPISITPPDFTPIGNPIAAPSGSKPYFGGPLYQTSIWFVIIMDLIFALSFAVYGIALFVQRYKNAIGDGQRRELVVTSVVTVTFAACFLLRFVMYIYRPITGGYLNPVVFRVLAYFVPEIVAVLLQVGVVYLFKPAHSSNYTRATNGPRPSVEDDVYYYAADQDLRRSAMPAPIAAAHERLIAPPRPQKRNTYSSNTTNSAHTSAATSTNNSATNTQDWQGRGSTAGQLSPATSPRTSAAHAALLLNSAEGDQAPVPIGPKHTHVGSPLRGSSYTAPIQTGLSRTSSPPGSPFTPLSFSPTHDQIMRPQLSQPIREDSLLAQPPPSSDDDVDQNEVRSEPDTIIDSNSDEDLDEADEMGSLIPRR